MDDRASTTIPVRAALADREKIFKIWSMMFATMTGVAKVEVAAAGAAGILVTILVLLVASPSFTCFLQQFRILFS